MKTTFEEFKYPSHEDWINAIEKEIKTTPLDKVLTFNDEIENLHLSTYKESNSSYTQNGEFPFTSSYFKTAQEWLIGVEIEVEDEISANTKALQLLDLGANSLNFKFNSETIHLEALLKDIQYEYVDLSFEVINQLQKDTINEYFTLKPFKAIRFKHTPISTEEIQEFSNYKTENSFLINAFECFERGANCTQELVYALSLGHEYLLKGIHPKSIHFQFGIGANYFVEIAKFRAFRTLWSTILRSYSFADHATYLIGKTGFVHRSIKDPSTNYVRQTIETLAGVLGGVDEIITQPHDLLSNTGTSQLAERMTINCSLLLQEEAHLKNQLDAYGGGHAIEECTHQLSEETWKQFKTIEELGSILSQNGKEYLQNELIATRKLRLKRIVDNDQTFIGVNHYLNETETSDFWLIPLNEVLGLQPFVLEYEYLLTTHEQ
jgi:methylmalonyl-CoA mutase